MQEKLLATSATQYLCRWFTAIAFLKIVAPRGNFSRTGANFLTARQDSVAVLKALLPLAINCYIMIGFDVRFGLAVVWLAMEAMPHYGKDVSLWNRELGSPLELEETNKRP